MLFLSTVVAAPTIQLEPLEIGFRLVCAMILGLIIGLEREYTHRPAGMRTHILVALGACAVMITGQLIFVQYRVYGGTADPARLSAQVITGVGFLGAGTILREGTNVKGLTTAASLWSVACLGIAAGGGYYAVALAGMVFIFITLTVFEVLQTKLIGSGTNLHNYQMETSNIADGLDALNDHARNQHASIHDIHTKRQSNDTYLVTFHAYFGGFHGRKHRERFFAALSSDHAVTSVRVCDSEATAVQ